ncbi:hypothetical protein BK659_07385 [Pseudomonas brassicacearum]|uniref:Uncharacterized protein n=1 Tax=Pseudomonas brassicacearum TaxID=930166 RepID=A0A423H971_9PSED|nr:hypothetical protein BK659_07385 [Pseudomonas brassicacearum]
MAFAVVASTPFVFAIESVVPDRLTVMIAFLAFATAIAVSVGRMTYSLSAGAATATVTRAVTATTTFCIGRGHWE